MKMVQAQYAESFVKLMARGRVLAIAPAYDAAHAEVTAHLLLRRFPQFDGVLITPVQQSARLSKEARREMKRAYLTEVA
jgi:hypothetical protein